MSKVNNLPPGSLPTPPEKQGLFTDRLRVLMNGQSERSFAKNCGFTHGAIRGYLHGGQPTLGKLKLICAYAGVEFLWLATGEGPMRPGEEVPPPPAWEKEKASLETKVYLLKEMAALKQTTKQPPPAWEQEKAELEEKMRDYRHLQEHLEAGKRENELLREMKQLPPPPTAGGGVADMFMLGLAECGLEGWLLKKPLSAKAVCPADMNSAENFAVIATGQSLFHAGIEPGFTCFCAVKSAPLVGDIVYVLKPSNKASLGVVRELEHKEKGSKTPWLVLQKWHDLDPKTGLREPYTLRENRDELEEIVPVIYVQRRPI